MERISFVFYKSFYEAIKELQPEDRETCFTALMEYVFEGKEPEMKGVPKAIFSLIKPQVDANNVRFENGCKGGRPTKEEAEKKTKTKPNGNQTKTKTKPNPNLMSNEKGVMSYENGVMSNEKENGVMSNEKENGVISVSSAPAQGENSEEEPLPFGQYGRVMLTTSQYNKLLADIGKENVDRCVQYIDELAQSSNNKNRWTDWDLVLRRCHREGWGTRGTSNKSAESVAQNYKSRLDMVKEWAAGGE